MGGWYYHRLSQYTECDCIATVMQLCLWIQFSEGFNYFITLQDLLLEAFEFRSMLFSNISHQKKYKLFLEIFSDWGYDF